MKMGINFFLIPSVLFSFCLSFWFPPFLISLPILILSTIFLNRTKKLTILDNGNPAKKGCILDHENEDSKFDWMSDEDEDDDHSLIEIAIPGEESGGKLESDLSEFLAESVLRKEGLMEWLAEINEVCEEDNLIEIDISLGSIKCSNLEINV